MVPCRLVQERFGYTGSDAAKLIKWSYWSQIDAFHNQPFDGDVIADPDHVICERKKAGIHLGLYLGRVLIKRWIQLKLHHDKTDPVTRLLRLSGSKGVKFPLKKGAVQRRGLLIGAIETTSVAVCNALDDLLARPDMLARARSPPPGPTRRV
jgi:cytochrome P450